MNGYLKDMGYFYVHGVNFFSHTTVSCQETIKAVLKMLKINFNNSENVN